MLPDYWIKFSGCAIRKTLRLGSILNKGFGRTPDTPWLVEHRVRR